MLRKVPRWAKIVAGALALYAALGFLLLPFVIRRQMEARLPPLLHRPVTVREVAFNPFDIALTVRGFSVREKDGSNFVSFEELKVDLAFLRLLTGKVRFEEISLTKPAIDVSLLPGGKLSFADLLEGPSEPKPKDEPPPAVSIERLRIDDGSVGVVDASRGAPVRLRVTPLSLHFDNFTTEPAQDSPYSFTARMDPDTTFSWKGELSINPLRSSGTVAIEKVALAAFAPYLSEATRLRLAGGFLSVRGKYRFDATRSPPVVQLEDGAVELAALRLDGPGARGPLVELEKLRTRGIRFDLAKRSAAVEEVALEGGHIRVRRDKDGAIELQRLAQPPAQEPATKQVAAAPAEQPFHTALQKFRIAGLRVEVEDLVPAAGARFELAPIDLAVGPLEWPTTAAIPLSLSVGINGQGAFTVKGAARPDGAAAVDLGLQRIALAWAQPYVSQSSNAQLRGGVLALEGHAKYAPGKPARSMFDGNVSLDGLSVFAPGVPKEILGFDRFALEKLSVALPPNDVRVGRVLLRGLRARVSKNEDRTSNVDALSKGPKKPPPPGEAEEKVAEKPAPAKAAPPTNDRYAAGAFVIENAAIEYADRSVAPAFSVRIAQLSGKAAPLSWPQMAKTRFDFSAKVDAAPWVLQGEVEPKGPKRADLNAVMTMKGWDLLPTTGYALKATGYPVQKGKFSLDMKYKILERKIEGENVVVIDQLTLGDHQDVKGATSLPVKLALAILTDRDGVLKVDLPVSGDLDDPSFSFGRMVWATVKNLLVKVATSPFALLGSLAGGNDDLSSVAFDPGSSDLARAEAEKLEKLGKLLLDRPALKVEIEGKVDSAADGAALRREKVEERITAGRPASAQGPVTTAEREALVRAEWTRARAAAGKPADAAALPTPQAMEAELVAAEALTPDDLAALASERAEEVQGKLLEVQGLTPERVFVTAPHPDGSTPAAVMALK